MIKNQAWFALSLLFIVGLSGSSASAQTYQLSNPTFSGAAVESANAQYILRGTAGEAGVVGLSSNASHQMSLGFWHAAVSVPNAATGVDPEVPGFVEIDFRAVPNPFNPRTEFRFSLPVAGSVELSIYDVAGRAVTTLRPGALESGAGAVSWNGVDSAGRTVSTGQYFARLLVDGHQLDDTIKISLIK